MKKEEKQNKNPKILVNSSEKVSKQEQIHDIIFSKEIGWKEIIYDLINTEQLNAWDIDINILTDKYLEKIEKLEEENYFVSSKVLLAAALLLRIKSEVLLNQYIKSIDEILFGKKETAKKIEIIELDEEIPELIPRSPFPRFKKVTLNELVESLNKAIITEGRRIKKEIVKKDSLRETSISLPKKKYVVNDKIKEIYKKLVDHFQENQKISFNNLVKNDKDEKIISFHSLLHLENQNKIWIEQKEHFGEIHIWFKKTYFKENPDHFSDLIDED
tara:strand:+ start:931 stop:1749 length:819 start_codon:yes stop_codon:yes gene_type:complete